jgi:hypothetical protein
MYIDGCEASRLKVVPNAPADARFGLLEEFKLVALAVEIFAADAEVRAAGILAPHPTELDDKVAAVVDFLSQVRVRRQEWSATNARVASLRPVKAKLEFKRFGAARRARCIAEFAVETKSWRKKVAGAKDDAVADEVQPLHGWIHQHQLVAEMAADVIVAALELPLTFAIRQRDAEAIVAGQERRAFAKRIEPRENAAFDIELPTFRPIGIVVAVAPQPGTSAERDVPRCADHVVLIPKAAQARFFRAGHVRLINKAVRQDLRVPFIARRRRRTIYARRGAGRGREPARFVCRDRARRERLDRPLRRRASVGKRVAEVDLRRSQRTIVLRRRQRLDVRDLRDWIFGRRIEAEFILRAGERCCSARDEHDQPEGQLLAQASERCAWIMSVKHQRQFGRWEKSKSAESMPSVRNRSEPNGRSA